MSTEPIIIPAATVLLLRDSPHGLEVFMVVRHHKIDAFSGALVFPGGKVDQADNDSLFVAANDHRTQIAFKVAAIREAFEECGILLARDKNNGQLISAERLQQLSHYRQALVQNKISMAQLCHAEALELTLDLLHHYAHWITPKTRPKIFDTHFFIVPAPFDQSAVHDGVESLDSMWIRPELAITAAEQGELTVVFPTRMNLRRLSAYSSVQTAIDACQQEIVTVQPVIEKHEQGQIMTIPKHAGYGVERVLVPKDGRIFQILQ